MVGGFGSFDSIRHYDGSTWSNVITANSNPLNGVWGSSTSSIFAVGETGTALHYDGTTWSAMISAVGGRLNDVWGASASAVFAVGQDGAIIEYPPTTASLPTFDLTTASTSGGSVTTPIGATTSHTALDVVSIVATRDADHAFVNWTGDVGTVDDVNASSTTITMGFDKSITANFTPIELTVTSTSGGGITSPSQTTTPQVLGSTVSLVATPNTGFQFTNWSGDTGTIADLNASSTTIVMDTSKNVIAHFIAIDAVSIPMGSGTPMDLYGIWANSTSDIIAVGENQTVLQNDGTGWTSAFSGFTSELEDVWSISASDAFTVGGFGSIDSVLHYDGATWSNVITSTNIPLKGIWGASASDYFAVGQSGLILRYDGATWNTMTSGTAEALNEVWGESSSNVIAVGSNGLILNYNGTAWSAMTSGITTALKGLWGNSATDVFAVGNAGVILHYDGSSWSPMTSGTTIVLEGVWGRAANDVYAVGQNGTILHYDGTSWSAIVSNSTEWLFGVHGTATNAYAVGANGTILHLLIESAPPSTPIPSLSWWGMLALAALLLVFGAWRWRRTAKPTTA